MGRVWLGNAKSSIFTDTVIADPFSNEPTITSEVEVIMIPKETGQYIGAVNALTWCVLGPIRIVKCCWTKSAI